MSGDHILSLNKNNYQQGWLDVYENKENEFIWQEKPIPALVDNIHLLKSHKVNNILEVGCGDGRNLKYLLENEFCVSAIDLSFTALERAKNICSDIKNSNVLYIQYDIEELPGHFLKKQFDAITCFDVFGQLLHIDSAIKAFYELLKPGGMLFMNLYSYDDVSYGEGQKVAEDAYLYNNTLFRFFNENDIQKHFHQFEPYLIERRKWLDPPHPGYRDYEHTHDNYIVILLKP